MKNPLEPKTSLVTHTAQSRTHAEALQFNPKAQVKQGRLVLSYRQPSPSWQLLLLLVVYRSV